MRCASIQLGNKKILVDFKYERLPSVCYYCGLIGHTDKACDQRTKDITSGVLSEGLFGDWLRAQDNPSPSTHCNWNESPETPSKDLNNSTHQPSNTNNTLSQSPSIKTSQPITNIPLSPTQSTPHQTTNPPIPTNTPSVITPEPSNYIQHPADPSTDITIFHPSDMQISHPPTIQNAITPKQITPPVTETETSHNQKPINITTSQSSPDNEHIPNTKLPLSPTAKSLKTWKRKTPAPLQNHSPNYGRKTEKQSPNSEARKKCRTEQELPMTLTNR
ncbi:zinc knuckle (CCHC-type) family protein [Striga asiatica]|uniref:Zinc knuckle (CCHC-type) family protein n=1 Tax=Striga asiatica TaxID=4170 RepID=A0A5A7R8N8_STRAF|nr:zinc knuckle (CCHC-type) family protein [Striga asiatica]